MKKLRFEDLTCNGYGFLEEILTALHRQGAKLTEMPITYHVRQAGRKQAEYLGCVGCTAGDSPTAAKLITTYTSFRFLKICYSVNQMGDSIDFTGNSIVTRRVSEDV